MNILIVEQPGAEVTDLIARLDAAGHEVRHIADPEWALNSVRTLPPDLLISALFDPEEAMGGDCGLAVPVAAQFHNPALVTILLSDSALFSQGELFAMLGSLRCVMHRPAPVDDLVEVATHFLAKGPVGCAPTAAGPDICGKCLLDETCKRANQARTQLQEDRARAIAGRVDAA